MEVLSYRVTAHLRVKLFCVFFFHWMASQPTQQNDPSQVSREPPPRLSCNTKHKSTTFCIWNRCMWKISYNSACSHYVTLFDRKNLESEPGSLRKNKNKKGWLSVSHNNNKTNKHKNPILQRVGNTKFWRTASNIHRDEECIQALMFNWWYSQCILTATFTETQWMLGTNNLMEERKLARKFVLYQKGNFMP